MIDEKTLKNKRILDFLSKNACIVCEYGRIQKFKDAYLETMNWLKLFLEWDGLKPKRALTPEEKRELAPTIHDILDELEYDMRFFKDDLTKKVERKEVFDLFIEDCDLIVFNVILSFIHSASEGKYSQYDRRGKRIYKSTEQMVGEMIYRELFKYLKNNKIFYN